MDEERYTEDEWNRKKQIEACARSKHSPSIAVLTGGSAVADSYLCDCGLYIWLPKKS